MSFSSGHFERRKNKKEIHQRYILRYNYQHLITAIVWPFKICNRAKEIKKYLADIDNLKVDISLENIMQSLIDLKDQVAKINEDQRQLNYQEINANI